jgi:hypothetical protein
MYSKIKIMKCVRQFICNNDTIVSERNITDPKAADKNCRAGKSALKKKKKKAHANSYTECRRAQH